MSIADPEKIAQREHEDHVPGAEAHAPGAEPDDPTSETAGETTGDAAGETTGDPAGGRRGWRPVAWWTVTALACLFVLFALLMPNKLSRLTPEGFAHIPAEGVLGVALVLVLPSRTRRVAAALIGAGLGLLVILRIVDMGFKEVLARPFDPVLDWVLVRPGVEFLDSSLGRGGAIAAVIAIVLLAAAVVVLMALSFLRLTRLVVRYNTTATGTVAVLGTVWVMSAALGAQLVPGTPVAASTSAKLAYFHARQVRTSLQDRQEFARQAAVDAFRDTPGNEMLTGLKGKDVVLTFVESYGRDAIEDPEFAPGVGAVLDSGTRRLREAGYSSRSAFLTSPTAGGGSWLAHSTLLSGLWIDNEQRYRSLVSSDRLTLNRAFQRADWRSVGVMPAIMRSWPEGGFYGYDKIYDSRNIGYRGPHFAYSTMPDQYTMSAFERAERGKDGPPVMAEVALLSSHAPWASIPQLVDWDDVGDGSVYTTMADGKRKWPASDKIRGQYRRSIEYSLNTLISYVEAHGDEDLVFIFLGDHEPAPMITGEGAGHDVPITVVARDHTVVDRISGWGWQDGLKPGPKAPVWKMSAFRDRFLTAFGSTPHPAGPSTH